MNIKYLFISLFLSFLSIYSFGQVNKSIYNENNINEVATNALMVLTSIQHNGLENNKKELKELINIHQTFAKRNESRLRFLSLVISDAISYAIVSEIYRNLKNRENPNVKIIPEVKIANKETVLEIWNLNEPKFKDILDLNLKEKGQLIDYVKSRNIGTNEIIQGKLFKSLPLGPVKESFQKMRDEVNNPFKKRNLSSDELFIFTLVKWQAYKDLTHIAVIYSLDNNKSVNYETLRNSINERIVTNKTQRMDSGMPDSAVNVLLTFSKYSPPIKGIGSISHSDVYKKKLEIMFAPFISNTNLISDVTILFQ